MDEKELDNRILAAKDRVESLVQKAIKDKDPYWLETEDRLFMYKLGGVGRRKHGMNESFWCPPRV
jgi:hypothetical protein